MLTPKNSPSKDKEDLPSKKDVSTHQQPKSQPQQYPMTILTIKYDAGFPNNLFIRGQGANLSWNRGIPLENIASDLWIWEPSTPFDRIEYKILLNDERYENGPNHSFEFGSQEEITPDFN